VSGGVPSLKRTRRRSKEARVAVEKDPFLGRLTKKRVEKVNWEVGQQQAGEKCNSLKKSDSPTEEKKWSRLSTKGNSREGKRKKRVGGETSLWW